MKSADPPRRHPFFLAGATASGKSAVAIELALLTRGEIVNADAFQLYRGLDTLTAKPSPEDTARVPHHLFSILEPTRSFSAAEFESLARQAIREILDRGSLPIVVGGSGLYLKTLTHGLSPLPPADPALRHELGKLDPQERVRKLLELDPGAAEVVDLANPRYVTRALEICILTGRPASELQSEWASRHVVFHGVIIHRDRQSLYRRIDQRTVSMLESGAIDEVSAFSAISVPGDPHPSLTAGKAIGIREIQAHLQGESTLAETISSIQKATRNYAKRQLTWFKREIGFDILHLTPETSPAEVVADILSLFPQLAP